MGTTSLPKSYSRRITHATPLPKPRILASYRVHPDLDVPICSPLPHTHAQEAGFDCTQTMVDSELAHYGLHLNNLLAQNIDYVTVVWSVYGRPHSTTLIVLRILSKCISFWFTWLSASPGCAQLGLSSRATVGGLRAPHLSVLVPLAPSRFSRTFVLGPFCLSPFMSDSRCTALRELIAQLSARAAQEDAVQEAIRTALRSAASSEVVSAARQCLPCPPLVSRLWTGLVGPLLWTASSGRCVP